LNEEGEKLRTIGAEFGATTGRPRRCGWYDAFLVAYSQLVNGITSVAITKLDVLSGFDKIKVCIGYELNGKRLKYFPSSVDQLSAVKPVYEVLDGWNEDITNYLSYEQLPSKTKEYLQFIGKHSGIKIEIISVGPKRKQTFYVQK
jgi:adenylosuccinate synthase